MNTAATISLKVSKQCEALLYTLVATIVFEGIIRKLVPFLSIPIFFLKDILCLAGLFLINTVEINGIGKSLFNNWKLLSLLFLPLLLFTGFKEVILAVFACKQYLLYVITAIILITSFSIHKENRFRIFVFFIISLLAPTTVVAILQNSLPPTHWLNLSVTGESLESFSAAGYLRVSSTFSFTGQYSWFLNAETFLLIVSFFMPPDLKLLSGRFVKPAIYFSLALMLFISAFITGGRTAVIGSGAILTLGLLLIGMKRPAWLFSKGLIIAFSCVVCFSIVKEIRPQFFATYDERSNGYGGMTQNEELSARIVGGFTDWTTWFWEEDAAAILLGNGLGVMSNGSNQVSTYAARIRANGFWTEGDVPTTFWEGGIYLALIWYGFRLSIIFLCFRIWRAIKDNAFASAGSVTFAYITISGITSQFGMQPPLYIWWFVAVGVLIFIYRLDRHKQNILAAATNKKHEEYSIH